jgi:capsular polysaccharide biosynthesis protein
MKLQDYIAVLRKRWWVIALTACVAAVAAYGVSKLQPRIYTSQAVYLFIANQADNGLNITLRDTMNSYKESVQQPDVLEQISQNLHLDVSGERLLQDVDMQTLPDEQKLIIQVDNKLPDKAQQIADAVGTRVQEEVNRRNALFEGTSRIFVQPIQKARLPTAPSSPNTRINVLAGFILGLVLGLLLTFVLEFLDDTIKDSADVERFVGLTMLGAIPTVEARRETRTENREPRAKTA